MTLTRTPWKQGVPLRQTEVGMEQRKGRPAPPPAKLVAVGVPPDRVEVVRMVWKAAYPKDVFAAGEFYGVKTPAERVKVIVGILGWGFVYQGTHRVTRLPIFVAAPEGGKKGPAIVFHGAQMTVEPEYPWKVKRYLVGHWEIGR